MEVVAFVAGALGLGYGVWSRYYLWRWSQECKGTRIGIAYKRKVKLDMPLTEWMLWARQAAKDKDKAGPARTVFTGGGTTVFVVQRVKATTVWKMRWQRARKGDSAVGPTGLGPRSRPLGQPRPAPVAPQRDQAGSGS